MQPLVAAEKLLTVCIEAVQQVIPSLSAEGGYQHWWRQGEEGQPEFVSIRSGHLHRLFFFCGGCVTETLSLLLVVALLLSFLLLLATLGFVLCNGVWRLQRLEATKRRELSALEA